MTSLKALKCLILPGEKLGFEIMLPHFVLHGITVVSEYTERFNFDTWRYQRIRFAFVCLLLLFFFYYMQI